MKFTPELASQIAKVLIERGAMSQPCPLCGQTKWSLAHAFYFLAVQDNLPNINLAGSGMPCVALICGNCGNTHLINLAIIGLAHLFRGDQS